MTLSAWIRPTAAQGGWRTIMQREVDAVLPQRQQRRRARCALGRRRRSAATRGVASGPTAEPGERVDARRADLRRRRTCGCTSTARRSRSRAASGAIQTNSNPLWIGGNSPYGEYFKGLIDEVRVYNRALSPTEIQTDMNTSIVPTAPDTIAAVGADRARRDGRVAARQINLSWTRGDRQHRRDRLPRRALPGRRLHELRRGGDADRRRRSTTPA